MSINFFSRIRTRGPSKPKLITCEVILLLLLLLFFLSTLFIKFSYYRKSYLTSDIALYMNIFWNTDFHRHFLFTEYLHDLYGWRTFLKDHFAPSILLFVPLYKLLPFCGTLLVTHSLAVTLTGILIYVIGRDILRSKILALFCAVGFLFHPSTVMATIDSVYGFHHDCLIPLLLAGAVLALINNRFKTFSVILIILMGLKESLVFTGITAGIILLFVPEYRKYGWVTLAMACLFGLVGMWIYPLLGNFQNRHAVGMISKCLSLYSSADARRELLDNLPYWVVMFSFLPAVFKPALLILIVPDLTMFLLAGIKPIDWHIFSMVTFLSIGSIYGLATLQSAQGRNIHAFIRKQYRLLTKISVLILILTAFLGNMTLCWRYLKIHSVKARVDFAELSEIKKIVSSEDSIATTADLLVHFANRRHLYWHGSFKPDYILVNIKQPYAFTYDREYVKLVEDAFEKGQLSLIHSTPRGLLLYKQIR